ncbi:MAG: signal peptidase I [Candidatus Geothermincolia bacterium]
MRHRRLLRFFAAMARLAAILLVALAMSLALLLITQRIFNPFHIVASNSMSPQIKTGDAVIMKDLEASQVKPGEVIIFHDPNDKENLVIHRVVNVEDRGGVQFFSTKGDNNKEPDNWKISSGEVLGGVAVKIPGFGAFLNFVTTPKGYTSLIVIPAIAALLIVMLLGFAEKLVGLSRRDNTVPPPA